METLALAAPARDEVEVRIRACAICHSDLSYIDGLWPVAGPTVFGHEAAGVVSAVGEGVTGFRAGDRVCVTLARACGACHSCARGRPSDCGGALPIDGRAVLSAADGAPVAQGIRTAAFAEAVVVHVSQIVTVPDSLPWAAAAVLSCGVLTGYGAAVNSARVAAGDAVAVIGVGGVGVNAVQAARIAGAAPVIAIDTSATRRAAAAAFGATDALDPLDGDMATAVLALTGGRGLDHAIVCAGAGPAIDLGLALLARGGAVTIAGMPAEDLVSAYAPNDLVFANRTIRGSRFGQAVVARDIPLLCGLYAEGALRLDELVTAEMPFDRINEALDLARSGQGLRTVLTFGEGAP